MQQAHFNIATVGVFSWVSLQPSEDHFAVEWLDTVIDKLEAGGRNICLATPTAAQPAWMSQAYPGVLRSDERGQRRRHGGRTNFCHNSSPYRCFAVQVATRLAERYKEQSHLLIWHISNEYAGGGLCSCETCAALRTTKLHLISGPIYDPPAATPATYPLAQAH